MHVWRSKPRAPLNPTDRRILRVLDLVECKLGERLTADNLAAEVGLSGSHLKHLFRTQTGLTLKAYVREARMSMARSILLEGKLAVKETASKCGYSSPENFTKEFKRGFGKSPSLYRRSTVC